MKKQKPKTKLVHDYTPEEVRRMLAETPSHISAFLALGDKVIAGTATAEERAEFDEQTKESRAIRERIEKDNILLSETSPPWVEKKRK